MGQSCPGGLGVLPTSALSSWTNVVSPSPLDGTSLRTLPIGSTPITCTGKPQRVVIPLIETLTSGEFIQNVGVNISGGSGQMDENFPYQFVR
jgi:hypothetical protein